MNKTKTGARYLRIHRYWFDNQATTQHVSTWADICNSLRIDDEPEDIETIALKVSVVTFKVPVHVLGENAKQIRILE
tara:strand:+ start:272 stop:502 length:231 start_codon:yes stop_codon:yes gene_type:complete